MANDTDAYLYADIDRARDGLERVRARVPSHLEQTQQALDDGVRGCDAAMSWVAAQELKAGRSHPRTRPRTVSGSSLTIVVEEGYELCFHGGSVRFERSQRRPEAAADTLKRHGDPRHTAMVQLSDSGWWAGAFIRKATGWRVHAARDIHQATWGPWVDTICGDANGYHFQRVVSAAWDAHPEWRCTKCERRLEAKVQRRIAKLEGADVSRVVRDARAS